MTTAASAPEGATRFVFEADGAPRDTGLFGPGSVAWRVWSHPAAFVGAIRSFQADMLSSAEGAAAVADFGGYQSDSLGRLQRTMEYFLTVIYGDTATVDKANLRLRRMHQRITGSSPVTKSTYSGVDPLLMLGTHLMTWHSAWVCYETLVGRQPVDDERRFFAESARAAEALGLGAIASEDWRRMAATKGYDLSELDDIDGPPATRQDFRRLLRAAEPTWCVTAQTREIIDTLLHPANPPDLRTGLLYRLYPALGNAAAATLPQRMRTMASIPTSPTWEARAITTGRAAVRLADLPLIDRAFQDQICPRGYQLMRQATR